MALRTRRSSSSGSGVAPSPCSAAYEEAAARRSRWTDWRWVRRATQERMEPCFGSYASGFSQTWAKTSRVTRSAASSSSSIRCAWLWTSAANRS